MESLITKEGFLSEKSPIFWENIFKNHLLRKTKKRDLNEENQKEEGVHQKRKRNQKIEKENK